MKLSRRTFLKDASLLLAGLGLSPALTPAFAEALAELADGRAPLLWLQGQSCSGCSVSLLNSENPGPADLLTRYLSLYFHQTLSAATGDAAHSTVETAINTGGYILAVEGAVPLKIKDACRFAGEDFVDLLSRAAQKARAVIAVGTCAAFGGVPEATPNLFAVVAEEVRNLAARSAKAAAETAELIEGSVEKTTNGSSVANQTAEALHEIVTGISEVTDLVSNIAAASNEQAQGVAQISQGVSQIDQVTEQNAASSEECAATAEELSSQAEQMRQLLQRFILKSPPRHLQDM